MRNPFRFKSIYAKFAVIFLSVWWLLNSLTFGVVIRVMSNNRFAEFAPHFSEMSNEFNKIKMFTGLAFLACAGLGTIIILFVVRGIVKPIKQLSAASK